MKKTLLLLAAAIIGMLSNLSAQVILSEDFESVTMPAMPAGWIASGLSSTFRTDSGRIILPPAYGSPYDTIPSHTIYAYTDEYNLPGDYPMAHLTTPVFSLSGISGTPYLSYDYIFFHRSAYGPYEKAWVEISTDGGTTYSLLDSLSASGRLWASNIRGLSSYIGSANCMIRFSYTDNLDTLKGIALDNIKVFVAPSAGVSVNEASASLLSVRPNPTTDDVTIRMNCVSVHQRATLYGVDGRVLKEFIIGSELSTLSLDGLPAGIYVIKCGGFVERVVKE